MEKIAVIGAGGFIGSRLIESFILDGFKDVYPIVRSNRSLANLCRFGIFEKIRIANAENEKNLLDAIKDCSIVINLISSNPKGIINSTKVIYDCCIEAKVRRLIHLSSAVVYGQVESPKINDNSPLEKHHWMPYARAKIKAELFLRNVLNLNAIEITVLRPGIVWGPRSGWSLNAALDLINNTTYLVGTGSGICNTIYVDNLIACILTCCNYEQNASGFFNISDDELVTWRDFYGSLAEYLNYDMSKITTVSADRFKPSFNVRLQEIMSLPIYHKVKKYIKPETRALIKQWITKLLSKDDHYSLTNQKPKPIEVTREMWHLQQTKYKLSSSRFSKHFNYTTPFEFRYGIQMTINWLKYLGF